MPTLAELQSQADDLASAVDERDAASPERRLRLLNESIARFDILKVRRSGGLDLLNRIAEGTEAGGQRSVLVSLCSSWWDAVIRETTAAVGHLPDAMAVYSTVLPDGADDEVLRRFVADRLWELEQVLA